MGVALKHNDMTQKNTAQLSSRIFLRNSVPAEQTNFAEY